ncbi:gamma-glutamyl-gamma-aminobutyrate hydrolase family protein [Amorphus coralli]|uniref:gamma-glutamyl-gamma-aminobutyrate hydrolase family protein n=1 Tax=Amorphus coralli TaxID=340680 RepID=UPI00041C4822|nr:gamma-glutamyl-gamma-aminobutyrate hydrolase family protein [Amorphus coralli]
MSRRPLIGVTTSARGGWRSYFMTAIAIRLTGGRTERIMPDDDVEDLAGRLDGLVVGGGDDISAHLYGGEIVPDVRLDPDRDDLEIRLMRRVLPGRIPVLGICRGAQMLNVAAGGNLIADIYSLDAPPPRLRTILPRKTVTLVQGSRLARIAKLKWFRVNALHHQAIDRLGTDLKVVARDKALIVQAIEASGKPFRVGVQWHPELLVFKRSQRRLFRALVRDAQRFATGPDRHEAEPGEALLAADTKTR